MNKETEKLFDTCRACLELSNNTYPIFDETPQSNINIAAMLINCSIEVRQDDDFPKAFCSACFAELQTAYNFIQTFKKSQELLYQSLRECKEKIVVVDEEEILDVNNTNIIVEGNGFETEESPMLNSEPNENALDTAEDTTESFIIKYNSNRENGSYDSDDQNFLIEQSVKLTEHYKLHKLDDVSYCNESDTDDDVKEQDSHCEEINNDDNEIVSADSSSARTKCPKFSTLTCPLCPKTFKRFTLFSSHLVQHNREITCNLCFIEFNDIDIYLRHYQMKHRYQCKICHKSFPRGDTFSRHMHAHNNTLPKFICPFENCSKTFTVKQSLKNHYKTIHSEKRNFLCNLCGASFKNYDNLRYHLKKHKGPSHLCTYCGRAFMQAVHLKYHMWRHTGVKPYKCANCEKSFVSKRILITHQQRNCGRLRS